MTNRLKRYKDRDRRISPTNFASPLDTSDYRQAKSPNECYVDKAVCLYPAFEHLGHLLHEAACISTIFQTVLSEAKRYSGWMLIKKRFIQ